MKVCTKCLLELPDAEFYSDKRYTGNRRTWCKQCMLKLSKQWRSEHRDRIKEYKRRYKQKHRACLLEKRRLRKQQKVITIGLDNEHIEVLQEFLDEE